MTTLVARREMAPARVEAGVAFGVAGVAGMLRLRALPVGHLLAGGRR
jgi:hypothetical protein